MEDVRELKQGPFNQYRIDVMAPADDDVLGAACNEDEPIRVDPAKIAGDEPTIISPRVFISLRTA